ncbi:hypothetical protein EVAR_59242_1 [Eumeta japonica]|uniref:Uncharacterized protein n=1 Tax=Eumeta variegata TaxID=151549 RepID=A0A4C2A5X9_EUMVA|nr:hypothetical protein EVAR_59242_1 [Eumeta japonica]
MNFAAAFLEPNTENVEDAENFPHPLIRRGASRKIIKYPLSEWECLAVHTYVKPWLRATNKQDRAIAEGGRAHLILAMVRPKVTEARTELRAITRAGPHASNTTVYLLVARRNVKGLVAYTVRCAQPLKNTLPQSFHIGSSALDLEPSTLVQGISRATNDRRHQCIIIIIITLMTTSGIYGLMCSLSHEMDGLV